MTDHYDVIVVGSGAGGGTLTHALAPTGKRILLLERGDFLPREPQNWDSKSVWVDLRYHNSGTGRTPAPARSSRPSRTTTWAAIPRSTARSCSVSVSAISGRSSTSTASRRPGR